MHECLRGACNATFSANWANGRFRQPQIQGPAGPIVVCTRNDDLQAVVDATPAERRGDLVFTQNGMLQPWLDARGLGDNTQVSRVAWWPGQAIRGRS